MAPGRMNILILGLLSMQSNGFVFDTEEIKSLNFVVDILDQPVLLSETPEERTVQMYNRDGQPYSCLLPDTEPILQQQRDEPDPSQHTSVPSLLGPMSGGPCLQRTRDWWTYELCPMAEIRQYHMEGGQIVGKVSVLGRFESDYDWSRDDGRSRNAKHRYHSQTYVNGSDCDLTGRPRSAEVRYVCEEGGGDALVRVDEPETCRYVLTVQTSRTCGHRVLRPPPGRRPQPVTCRPALSAAQLQRLARARLERARRDGERAALWAAARRQSEAAETERRRQRSGEEEEEEEEEDGRTSTRQTRASYLQRAKELFDGISVQTKKLGDILDDVIHSYIHIVSEFNTETTFGVERLHTLRDRHRTARDHHTDHAVRIMELFKLAEDGHYHSDQIVKDLIAYTSTLSVFSEVMIGISEESRRLKEFMSSDPSVVTHSTLEQLVKTMTDLSSLSVQLQRFFTDTEAMQADLLAWQSDLVAASRSQQSAQKQQPPSAADHPHPAEEGTGDSSDVTEDSESPLQSDVLADKLLKSREAWSASDDMTSEQSSASDDMTSEQSSASDDVTSEQSSASDMTSEESSASDDMMSEQSSASDDMTSEESSASDDMTSEQSSAKEAERDDEDESPDVLPEDDDEDSSDASKKARVKFSTLESLRLDKMIQVSEIDRQQRSRIERAVKHKLGKVGLDTNGPEIKVRFLKFPDLNSLDKEHTLTEEEMSAFENALIAIMMGGQEALEEHDKHSQLAKNYDYSFDRAVQDLEAQDEQAADEPPDVDESLFTLV